MSAHDRELVVYQHDWLGNVLWRVRIAIGTELAYMRGRVYPHTFKVGGLYHWRWGRLGGSFYVAKRATH